MRLFRKFPSAIFCIAVVLFFSAFSASAQNGAAVFELRAADLANGKSIALDEAAWKYAAGDDAARAAANFDDSGWKTLTNDQINENPAAALENWNGRAWFRLRVRVDEQLVNQPLALRVWHWGASEIFLDGKLFQAYGEIKNDGETEFNPRGVFSPLVFTSGGEHTIAVRYSFAAASDLSGGRGAWIVRGGNLPGFRIILTNARSAVLNVENRLRSERLNYVFVGLLWALALVHFLLFAFYREARGNLFYSIFVFGLGATILLSNINKTAQFGAVINLLTEIARQNIQSLAVIALLAFLYVEFANRISRFFWILLALWIASLFVQSAHVWRNVPFVLTMLIAALADCLRIMMLALGRKRDGAWIIAIGIGFFVIGVANNIAYERGVHFFPPWTHDVSLNLTILSVPLAVSIYLARNFARTNTHLKAQLAQVKELSAKQLEHERTAADLRLAHERTHAENERRAKELEEARQLQLSMLPKKLPNIPNLEIAAYMKPASEVGGDYYDFYVSEENILTVAVGDATGHGLKAGSVVTATKSLFNAFAGETEIPPIFDKMNRALKKMNLRGLFMAMTMVKIKDNRLSICQAGMPSALVYRRASAAIEEIVLRAMPLGGVAQFPYKQQEINFEAGDFIVLMSDGFPEMFDESGAMLGDEAAKSVLHAHADKSPQEIIERLIETGEKWSGNRPADDDVTFVVLKMIGQ